MSDTLRGWQIAAISSGWIPPDLTTLPFLQDFESVPRVRRELSSSVALFYLGYFRSWCSAVTDLTQVVKSMATEACCLWLSKLCLSLHLMPSLLSYRDQENLGTSLPGTTLQQDIQAGPSSPATNSSHQIYHANKCRNRWICNELKTCNTHKRTSLLIQVSFSQIFWELQAATPCVTTCSPRTLLKC